MDEKSASHVETCACVMMASAPVEFDNVVDDPPVPELGRPVLFKLLMASAIMTPRMITIRRSEMRENPCSSVEVREKLRDMDTPLVVVVNATSSLFACEERYYWPLRREVCRVPLD
jgi:hypothetical protein